MILLLEYVVVASIVVFAAIKASHYIDLLDRTTKLSGAFLGGVLLSAVTSLPEFFTSLSATVFLDKPALCIGNILGSDLFNLAMLAVLALLAMRSFRHARIGHGNIVVALYMVLIYGVMLLNYFGILDVEWLTETLAGLMLEINRNFLKKGQEVSAHGIRFIVEAMEGHRIDKIKVIVKDDE